MKLMRGILYSAVAAMLCVCSGCSERNKLLTVHVLDKTSGRPLQGASVSIAIIQRPAPAVLNALTEGDGSAVLTIPDRAGLAVFVDATGYQQVRLDTTSAVIAAGLFSTPRYPGAPERPSLVVALTRKPYVLDVVVPDGYLGKVCLRRQRGADLPTPAESDVRHLWVNVDDDGSGVVFVPNSFSWWDAVVQLHWRTADGIRTPAALRTDDLPALRSVAATGDQWLLIVGSEGDVQQLHDRIWIRGEFDYHAFHTEFGD